MRAPRALVGAWVRGMITGRGSFTYKNGDTYLGAAVVQCSFLDAAAVEGGGVAGRRVRLA